MTSVQNIIVKGTDLLNLCVPCEYQHNNKTIYLDKPETKYRQLLFFFTEQILDKVILQKGAYKAEHDIP